MQHHHGSARNVARIASISSPIPGDYALSILFNCSALLPVLLSDILQLLTVDCKACYEPTQTISRCPVRADCKVSETSTSCSMKLCMFNGSVCRVLSFLAVDKISSHSGNFAIPDSPGITFMNSSLQHFQIIGF